MALGSSLKRLLADSSPYSDDMEDWQKRHGMSSQESGQDRSPQSMDEDNSRQETTPDHMKDYFDDIDDEGHYELQDAPKKSTESPMQADASSAAKSEGDATPFKRETISGFESGQTNDSEVIAAMRKSILDKLAGEYY